MTILELPKDKTIQQAIREARKKLFIADAEISFLHNNEIYSWFSLFIAYYPETIYYSINVNYSAAASRLDQFLENGVA